MGFFKKPKLSPPNELGFQFGIDESLTEYAHKELEQWGGNVLPALKVTVLQVWKDDYHVSNLIVDEETNEPIKECFGFEATACMLDALKVLEKSKENENKTTQNS